MDKIKWLLVGAGDIARKRVAAAISAAHNSELSAVCSKSIESAEKLADEFGAGEAYSDLGDALRKTDSDAVYIATPVWMHAPQAIQALEADRHVLVEKPLGLNFEDVNGLMKAARISSKVSGCAYYRRQFPAYRHASEMLAKGEFGQIVLVRMVYFGWFDPVPNDPKYWRVVKSKSGGGPLCDMGSHMLDMLIGLFGMPRSVIANCSTQVRPWDVEDGVGALFKLANDGLANASFHWNSKTWRHEFEIVGTEAKVSWEPCDSGCVVKTVGRNIETLQLPSAENVHQPVIDDFNTAIRERREPACSLREGAKTNALMDAVYQSAAEHREIEL